MTGCSELRHQAEIIFEFHDEIQRLVQYIAQLQEDLKDAMAQCITTAACEARVEEKVAALEIVIEGLESRLEILQSDCLQYVERLLEMTKINTEQAAEIERWKARVVAVQQDWKTSQYKLAQVTQK